MKKSCWTKTMYLCHFCWWLCWLIFSHWTIFGDDVFFQVPQDSTFRWCQVWAKLHFFNWAVDSTDPSFSAGPPRFTRNSAVNMAPRIKQRGPLIIPKGTIASLSDASEIFWPPKGGWDLYQFLLGKRSNLKMWKPIYDKKKKRSVFRSKFHKVLPTPQL